MPRGAGRQRRRPDDRGHAVGGYRLADDADLDLVSGARGTPPVCGSWITASTSTDQAQAAQGRRSRPTRNQDPPAAGRTRTTSRSRRARPRVHRKGPQGSDYLRVPRTQLAHRELGVSSKFAEILKKGQVKVERSGNRGPAYGHARRSKIEVLDLRILLGLIPASKRVRREFSWARQGQGQGTQAQAQQGHAQASQDHGQGQDQAQASGQAPSPERQDREPPAPVAPHGHRCWRRREPDPPLAGHEVGGTHRCG